MNVNTVHPANRMIHPAVTDLPQKSAEIVNDFGEKLLKLAINQKVENASTAGKLNVFA